MAITKILITVKTYPTISSKYDELVCTAGLLEDGTWIRIYPIQFRKKSFDEQYKKYDWIEIDLVKNTEDFRKESYRPVSYDTEIKILEHLDTRNNWQLRKEILFRSSIYNDMDLLISEAKNKSILTSLAIFKPAKFTDFIVEEAKREWDKNKLEKIKQQRSSQLFNNQEEDLFNFVEKLPYKFSYEFEDCQGKKCKLMIEDWEIGQLFWNCLSNNKGNEERAIAEVRNKYFEDFTKTKDLYLFLGTSKVHHYLSKNPFLIIGLFYPKLEITNQLSLF